MKEFGGQVLFLDRSDINTDEIIPAKYLNEAEKAALQPHLLEDLNLEGFDRRSPSFTQAGVVVTRSNFGCGSSREHALWALETNGIHVVVAVDYARIFRQNMFNGGMLAIELREADIEDIFALGGSGTTTCSVDLEGGKVVFSRDDGTTVEKAFTLAPFDEELVRAGGWVEYADAKY